MTYYATEVTPLMKQLCSLTEMLQMIAWRMSSAEFVPNQLLQPGHSQARGMNPIFRSAKSELTAQWTDELQFLMPFLLTIYIALFACHLLTCIQQFTLEYNGRFKLLILFFPVSATCFQKYKQNSPLVTNVTYKGSRQC